MSGHTHSEQVKTDQVHWGQACFETVNLKYDKVGSVCEIAYGPTPLFLTLLVWAAQFAALKVKTAQWSLIWMGNMYAFSSVKGGKNNAPSPYQPCACLLAALRSSMLASVAASVPPPLRRFQRGATLSASHGGEGVSKPLRPAPRRRALVCRADLQQDAPFAAAIGACVLASLALPPRRPRRDAEDEDEEEGGFSSTDTRMGVMGIISFLPYFNWLVSETSALLIYFSLFFE